MIKQTYGITKIHFLQSDLSLLPHQQEIADIVNIHSQHGGLCVITGDPGVGKTVIKMELEKQAQSKDHRIITFSRTMDTYSKIIAQMAESLELEVGQSKIENAIIDKNARIGNSVTISPVGKPENFDHPLYFVRDGIVVIPKGSTIPHGTVI